MPIAVVDTNAVQLAAADDRARMVRQLRSGTVTVYLGEDPQVTVNGGWPLEPGDSVTWEAGKPLYAIAPGRTTVYVEAAATSVFQASAVADQLVASGLAQDIADRIQIAGAPSIDDPQTLAADTFNAPAALASHSVGGGNLDVARYQSIAVRLVTAMTGAVLTAPATSGHIYISHYAAGTLIAVDEFLYLGDNQSSRIFAKAPAIVVPARGDQILVEVDYGTAGVPMTCTVVGSYRAVQKPSYFCGHGFFGASGLGNVNAGDGLDGFSSWVVAGLAASASWNEWPVLYAGPAILFFDSAAAITAGTITITVRDTAGGVSLGQGIVVPTGTSRVFEAMPFTVPARPVQLRITNSAAGVPLPAAAVLTITQETS